MALQRGKIIASIPAFMKSAISAGIGLFIAFIGLLNADIVKLIGDTVVDSSIRSKLTDVVRRLQRTSLEPQKCGQE